MFPDQVKIDKVSNGYIVSTLKHVFGERQPEQDIKVFETFEEVMEFLFPKKQTIQVK